MELTPDLEGRRDPDVSSGVRWFEGHRLDLFVPDSHAFGLAAVTLSLVAEPAVRLVSFSAVVLRIDRDPVVVADDDVPLPDRGWEFRSSGLWADHICETPLDHWSYGLEAFGLSLDDPDALVGRAMGERSPLGWELEFEARQPARWEQADHYLQEGIGHGLVLDADGQHEVEGIATRTHWWGPRPPEGIMVGEPPTDWPRPRSRVTVPSREATWRQALWGAGASSSSIEA